LSQRHPATEAVTLLSRIDFWCCHSEADPGVFAIANVTAWLHLAWAPSLVHDIPCCGQQYEHWSHAGCQNAAFHMHAVASMLYACKACMTEPRTGFVAAGNFGCPKRFASVAIKRLTCQALQCTACKIRRCCSHSRSRSLLIFNAGMGSQVRSNPTFKFPQLTPLWSASTR
jgi:hypothetical protein